MSTLAAQLEALQKPGACNWFPNESDLSREDRQREVAAFVCREGNVRIKTVMEEFDLTEMTATRDLNAGVEQGKLTRFKVGKFVYYTAANPAPRRK